jgi:hypothetical protein
MNKATKSKIEDAVEKVALADDSHERAVADAVLRTQTSDVLYELAAAALVDAARARRRRFGLSVERAAEIPSAAFESPRASRVTSPREVALEEREREEAAELAHMERMAEIDRRLVSRISTIVDEYVDGLRIEWTAELLGSEFALGDGTRVTWGDATAEQHRARAEMFQNNAVANLEGAARHQKALEALEQSGATTLREMIGASA